MSFKVKPAQALAVSVERVASILLMHRHLRTVWDTEALRKQLEELGLDFTPQEWARVNDELHARGIVEDV